MNKSTMAIAMVIALAAVFAIASPVDVAVAQTSSDVIPYGEGNYKDGEHEGKSCPGKERKLQEQPS